MHRRGIDVERAITEIKVEKLKECGVTLIGDDVKTLGDLPTFDQDVIKKLLDIVDSHERTSILLVGPPGAGKTFLAKSFLKTFSQPSIILNSSKLIQALTRRSFRESKILDTIESMNPNGILIDQFDILSGRFGLDHVVVMDKILHWLESRRFGILMGTTVKVEEIDPQLLRPGRFDAVVLVPPPDYITRKKILEYYGVKSHIASYLASRFKYYTPADLSNIARNYGQSYRLPRPNKEYQRKMRELYRKYLSYVSGLPNGVVLARRVN